MGKLLENRWLLLIVIALTWGSSFILIKRSLIAFTPYQIGAVRVAASGLILAYMGIPALLRMNKKTLLWTMVTGFFGNFLPMFLFPIAQTRISSSLAGILDSLVPAFVLVLGFLFFGVRNKWLQVAGAILGFVGAVILMGLSKAGPGESDPGHALLVVLATACYALAALIIKEKLQHVPSMRLGAAVYAIWMVPSIIILGFSGFFYNLKNTAETREALGYLGILTVFGTAIAMILYYKLIQKTSPVFASTVAYLLPLVAVIWGLVDGERFTAWYVIGGLLILLGIYLIRDQKKTPEAAPGQ